MAAKYAAVITYDNVASYAMAVAVKRSDLSTAAADSGHSTFRLAELAELQNGMVVAGYAVNPPLIAPQASLLATAQANALTLAGTL